MFCLWFPLDISSTISAAQYWNLWIILPFHPSQILAKQVWSPPWLEGVHSANNVEHSDKDKGLLSYHTKVRDTRFWNTNLIVNAFFIFICTTVVYIQQGRVEYIRQGLRSMTRFCSKIGWKWEWSEKCRKSEISLILVIWYDMSLNYDSFWLWA